MTDTSFADRKTQHTWSVCDASTLANDGISPLQHFRANYCDRTVWATQIMELWFSCFGSRHSSRPMATGASVDCSTSINIAKKFGDISHWFIVNEEELYQSAFYYHTSLTDHILRLCCSGTVCLKSLKLRKNMPEPSKLFLLKSHIYSLLLAKKINMVSSFLGSSSICITYCLHTEAMKFRYFVTENNKKKKTWNYIA